MFLEFYISYTVPVSWFLTTELFFPIQTQLQFVILAWTLTKPSAEGMMQGKE